MLWQKSLRLRMIHLNSNFLKAVINVHLALYTAFTLVILLASTVTENAFVPATN